MKKWTVMLIPHDRSSTRTLTLSSIHFWVAVALIAGLTFTTAFFFERHRSIQWKAGELRHANRLLELENARKPTVIREDGLSEEEANEIEARLRAEYETSIAAITAELSDLYDMETKAREITGMAPRADKSKDAISAVGGGKGGPPGNPGVFTYTGGGETMGPPYVIYGMTRPSADLILQEIRLRTRSFDDLVDDMEAEIDRIERIPSIWPLADGIGHITSPFGYRRDPFSHRLRHHNGTDIAGPYRAKILATAKGVVRGAIFDRYLGRVVKIDHGNGMETWYAHLRTLYVKKGDVVKREGIIGTLGSSGRSTGPHLHYEVHVKGKPVDSTKYLPN